MPPAMAPLVNTDFATSAISVLLKPTSMRKGVYSFRASALPTLKVTISSSMPQAPGEPSSSLSEASTDSCRLAGGGIL